MEKEKQCDGMKCSVLFCSYVWFRSLSIVTFMSQIWCVITKIGSLIFQKNWYSFKMQAEYIYIYINNISSGNIFYTVILSVVEFLYTYHLKKK